MKNGTFPIVIKRGSASVKIYKTPCRGVDRFTVAYWFNGGRKRQTFATLDEAKTEASTAATQLTRGDFDVLTLTSADRAAYLRARQLLDPLKVSLEAGAAQLAEALQRLGGVSLARAVEFYLQRHAGVTTARTVPEVAQELVEAKQAAGLSECYLRLLRSHMKTITAAFPGRIGDVTGHQIDAWLRKMPIAPRTRNNHRRTFFTLFSFAKARKYLPNDHDEMAAVPIAKQTKGEIEIFTPDEMAEILAVAGPAELAFLAIAAFAGVRHAELERLSWSDVQRDSGFIVIRAAKAKTASRRMIPILPNLRAWLEPIWQDEGLICCHASMTMQFMRLSEKVNKARRAAGRSGEFVWKHNALRHSFISYRVAQTQNVAQVALEAGNSPKIIFQHYRELVRPAQAEAWFDIMPPKLAAAPEPDATAAG